MGEFGEFKSYLTLNYTPKLSRTTLLDEKPRNLFHGAEKFIQSYCTISLVLMRMLGVRCVFFVAERRYWDI